MSLRRQYSLPNCTLILEGLPSSTSISSARPLLGILVNAECHFSGIYQKLQGGKSLVENLVQAVSAYAQECLSGIPHVLPPQTGEDQIRLEPIDADLSHRLIWTPGTEAQPDPIEIRLTTVQLFDLVEAVDQFLIDQQTLPDLALSLQPVPRRFRPPDEPLSQRVVPATIALASLAISALVLYFLPIPTVLKPVDTKPLPQTTETVPNSGNPPTSAPPIPLPFP